MSTTHIPNKIIMSTFLGIVLLTGCTKKRAAQWPDGTQENIFEISAIDGKKGSAVLGSTTNAVQSAEFNSSQALGEASLKVVSEAEVTEPLKPLFSELYVYGNSGQSLSLDFKVDAHFVTAYKVVSEKNLASLPIIEQQIAERTPLVGKDDLFKVPVFQVAVQEMGVAERVKNELGEETSTLRIKPTERAKATHIKISTLVKDRLDVQVPATARENASRVFLNSQLNNKILTKEEIKEQLGISLDLNGKYLVQSGVPLRFLIAKDYDSLSAEEKSRIALADNGQEASADTFRCSEKQAAELGISADKCVLDLTYEVAGVAYVKANRVPLNSTTLSANIEFVTAESTDQNGQVFIQISKDPLPVGKGKDPRTLLITKELRNAEFLYRRTLQDSPSTFSYTFAGSSGPLEIVKFKFKENSVEVVKADARIPGSGSTEVDQEVLLSFKDVKYFKRISTDTRGNPLPAPREVPTQFDDPESIAQVNWAGNTLPTISSPLEYYRVEQCFDGVRSQSVGEMDHRLSKDGILNFTLTSTYPGTKGFFDCAGIQDAGYFDDVQKVFTFKERISFKKHSGSATDEKPELDLPYDAQKKLGFGLFTYTRKVPNDRGLTHIDGTQINMPSLFDIKDGKTITYVLKGLPRGSDEKSKTIRSAVTEATEKVIDDINVAFRKALKGTPQERNDNVLKLVVEGVNENLGTLGDLDRNYIYYVEKATESRVIGLGGSHPNPRSGKVEAASVFMYGGNMLAMVDSMRRLDKASKEYRLNMDPNSHAGLEPKARGKSQPNIRPQQLPRNLPLDNNPEEKAFQAVSNFSKIVQKLERSKTSISNLKPGHSLKTEDFASALPRLGRNDLAVFNTLQAAKENGVSNSERIAQIYSAYFKNVGREVDISRVIDSPKARLEKAGFCVHEGSADILVDTLTDEYDIASKTDVQVLVDSYKATLAHELGHNLGLRHNFQGSFDKANFKFSEDEKTKRTFSSVMDYGVDDHIVYDGLAPYDVAALRAAYGKSVELANSKIVPIAEYKKLIGLDSWLNLTDADLRKVPLKKYLFCSDEEAGSIPTCNSHDWGSTAEEIVDYQIKSYRERYAIRNFPTDRLVFDRSTEGTYVGQLFSTFMVVRQFMDETFLKLITGQRENINDYVMAVVKGSYFFNQVLRTPEAPENVDNEGRFELTMIPSQNDQGQTIQRPLVVERKWSEDIVSDENSGRRRVRGVQIDKAIAALMLTSRGFGTPRYEENSIRFSYPDLEKYIFQSDDYADLPTMTTLKEVLANHVLPLVPGPDELGTLGSQVPGSLRYATLPPSFAVKPTELVRTYAILGSIIELDSVGLTAQDNLSASFRVLSNYQLPTNDIPFVQLVGAPNDLKYFAFDESTAGKRLVVQGHGLGQLRLAEKDLKPMFDKLVATMLEPATEGGEDFWSSTTNGLQLPSEQEVVISQINERLKLLPESVGPRTVEDIAPALVQIIQLGAQILQQTGGDISQIDPGFVESMSNQMTYVTKQAPSIGLALQSLLPKEGGGSPLPEELATVLALFIDENALRLHEGLSFRNVQATSDLFLRVHPEYRR